MIFNENQIEILNNEIKKFKEEGKKIIWTNWCFDLIHPWHIETFKKCKEIADIVIVWLNWEKSPYWKTKPWRPINDEKFRSTILDSLKYIDFVYIFNDNTPKNAIKVLKPNIVLKWWDYIPKSMENFIRMENWIYNLTEAYKKIISDWYEEYVSEKWFMPEALENVKNWWEVIVIPTSEWYSTTNIINKIKEIYE